MPAQPNPANPQPVANPNQASDAWKKAVGNPSVTTEYSQSPMNYSHDLALEDSSFSSKSADWALLAVKVFDTGKLRDANIVGADVSDFKVKVADPTDAKWDGLKEYIHDREKVMVGKELQDDGSGKMVATGADKFEEDKTNKTIDVGMLLLKGTDAQIKELMQGTYYSDKTVFIADKDFNEKIHERLKAISKEAQKADADKATNNYEGLRQESVAINSAVKEADGFVAGSPYTAVQGQKMGDGVTDIPVFSGVMADPLGERRSSRSPEQYAREEAFQALHGLIERNNAIETIESRFTTADEKNSELQRLVNDSTVTFNKDTLQEYQVKITVDAEKAYACLSKQEVDAYGNVAHPDNAADPDLQKKRDQAIKGLLHEGTPVRQAEEKKEDLVVTGILFNHTPAYGDGGAIKTLTAGDYLVAKDEHDRRYLIPLDDGVEEVKFGVGEKAKGVKEIRGEVWNLKQFLDSHNVDFSEEEMAVGTPKRTRVIS